LLKQTLCEFESPLVDSGFKATTVGSYKNGVEIYRKVGYPVNADDIEGIAYMGNHLSAILEESSSKIYVCKIDDSTKSIDLTKAKKVITVNKPDKNTGLEGVTYLPNKNVFYAVKEKDPKVIYCIDNETGHIKIPWDLANIKIDDVSDICYNTKTNNLLLLFCVC